MSTSAIWVNSAHAASNASSDCSILYSISRASEAGVIEPQLFGVCLQPILTRSRTTLLRSRFKRHVTLAETKLQCRLIRSFGTDPRQPGIQRDPVQLGMAAAAGGLQKARATGSAWKCGIPESEFPPSNQQAGVSGGVSPIGQPGEGIETKGWAGLAIADGLARRDGDTAFH